MRLVMGVLCYARPIHTALTLAFAYANKSAETDLQFFYGIPEAGEHKSPCLLNMLKRLHNTGHGVLNYLPEKADRNTGGNVDNLMSTLSSLEGYNCYFKVDDDVIIGQATDMELAEALCSPELNDHKVYILTAQAVREHMSGPRAFGWDFKLGQKSIVCRRGGQSPIETYAAISYKMLPHLEYYKLKTTCESPAGTFGPYSQKLWHTGAKAALVLFPSITMQHTGLTCTTGLKAKGAARSWAPAKSWSPAGHIIQVPHFDFSVWERSHITGMQHVVALEMIRKLQDIVRKPPLKLIIEELEKYEPGVNDVDLPIGRPDFVERKVVRKRRKRRVKIRHKGLV